MLNKTLLAVGVVVTISALASALTCQKCTYDSSMPESKQNCASGTQVSCSSGYCYTAIYTRRDNVIVVDRDCDQLVLDKYCPDAAKTCSDKIKQDGLKSCLGACCKTNNCNNFTPSSSASDVMVTKFIFCFTVIAGILSA